MKNFILIISTLFILDMSCVVSRIPQKIDSSQFIGTWVDEEDNDHQWIFTDANLTIKYPGSVDDKYSYSVSTTSPQCGESVSTTSGFTFLSLTDLNSKEQSCYYVNGFAEVTPGRKTLSLSEFNRSGAIVFVKQ